MTEIDGALIAVRLFAAAAALLLAPGLALLAALRIRAAWPEHTLLAFSASYAWVFLLSIMIPIFEWTIDAAAILNIGLVAGLVALSLRNPRSRRVGSLELGVGSWVPVILLGAAIAGWVIEPPFTGEEALDFASITRFADGGRITFETTSLLPDTRAVYLVQPYQLAIGAIARWAAIDPLVAFIKFRAVLAPLALVVVYALLRSLTPTRAEGFAALIVIVVCAALEIETWENNSIFPFVRRGTMVGGILMPALMTLSIMATRRVGDDSHKAVRTIALAVIPLFALAGMTTHALEIFTFLFFLAALAFAVLSRIDRGADVKRAAALVIVIGVALGSFMAIYARAVPYRASWDQAEKDALRRQLPAVSTMEAVAGDIGNGSGSLLARQSPLTAAATLGIPALAVAALRMPSSAALLAIAAVPLAVLYATRAGNIAIALMTSPQFSRDVDPYFMFLGLIGLALGLVTAAAAILTRTTQRFHRVTTAVLVTVVITVGGGIAALWFGEQASSRPGLFLHAVIVIALAVAGIAAVNLPAVIKRPPFPLALAGLAAFLAVPLALQGTVFGGSYVRETDLTVLDRFASAADRLDVFDRPAYYEELGRSISPPLTIPGTVVDEMRRRLGPR